MIDESPVNWGRFLTSSMHLVKLARILENRKKAEIAQLVEHATENCGVVSSILTLGTPDIRLSDLRAWFSW